MHSAGLVFRRFGKTGSRTVFTMPGSVSGGLARSRPSPRSDGPDKSQGTESGSGKIAFDFPFHPIAEKTGIDVGTDGGSQDERRRTVFLRNRATARG